MTLVLRSCPLFSILSLLIYAVLSGRAVGAHSELLVLCKKNLQFAFRMINVNFPHFFIIFGCFRLSPDFRGCSVNSDDRFGFTEPKYVKKHAYYIWKRCSVGASTMTKWSSAIFHYYELFCDFAENIEIRRSNLMLY